MRPSLLDRVALAISPGRWGWWLALVTAAASLVVIGIRPDRMVSVSPRVGVVITPGTTARVLDQLLDSLGGPPVARTPGAVAFPGHPVVRDLEQFAALYPEVVTVVVLGWGLDRAALERPPVGLIAQLAPPAAGIAAMGAPATARVGQPVRFSGYVNGPSTDTMMYLADATGTIDSASLARDGTFSLTWRPRAAGPARMELSLGRTAVTSETAMVDVVEPTPGRAVLIDASPSFETSALRRWLAKGGASVVHRTTLSRDFTREERVNAPGANASRLTRAWLRQFEIVVLDEATLGTMERGERNDLRGAIVDDGLGLLIVASGDRGSSQALDPSDRAFFLGADWDRFPELEQRSVRPEWNEQGPSTPPSPLATAPAVLEERFGNATVIRDGTGGVLAQVGARGAGKVGVVVGSQTSRWLRYGDEAAYAGFWTALLSEIMRDPPATERWQMAGGSVPSVDEQLVLEGWPAEDIDRLLIGTPSGRLDTVFVAAGAWGARPLRGVYWPRESGWHRIATPHGDRLFYVYQQGVWRSVMATHRHDATRRAAVLSPPSASEPGETVQVARPLPLGVMFILFLLSAAALWLGEDLVRPRPTPAPAPAPVASRRG